MNSDTLPPAVQKIVDRQDILDCLNRYSRGVDRLDAELLRSAYHPDAVDDHGPFVGDPEQFIRWSFAIHENDQIFTQHHLTCHNCELDGDEAHSETYFLFTVRNKDETLWFLGGRYLDRFERRNGEWKIANRYCVVEWSTSMAGQPLPADAIPDVHLNGAPGRDRTDPSYNRPLGNKRAWVFPQR